MLHKWIHFNNPDNFFFYLHLFTNSLAVTNSWPSWLVRVYIVLVFGDCHLLHGVIKKQQPKSVVTSPLYTMLNIISSRTKFNSSKYTACQLFKFLFLSSCVSFYARFTSENLKCFKYKIFITSVVTTNINNISKNN